MTEPSSGFTEFMLAQLRCAGLRARLIVTEIDSISVALRGNFITPDGALEWLRDAGALDLITASSGFSTER
jgi:hypothetical protein